MAMVQIIVMGDIDVVKMFDNIMRNIDSAVIKPFIADYANDLRNEMVRREHSITGTMRQMTQVRESPNGKSVVVDVPYAEDENMRSGIKMSKRGTGIGTPHNFVEPALEALVNKEDNELLMRIARFIKAS